MFVVYVCVHVCVCEKCAYVYACMCQGGFSAVLGTEVHGGYIFCEFAALVLLNRTDLCDFQDFLIISYISRLVYLLFALHSVKV